MTPRPRTSRPTRRSPPTTTRLSIRGRGHGLDDFDAFKQDDGDEPPDGNHTAWLERTSVFQSKAGPWFIRTCWRTTDMTFYWETLNGTTGQSKQHTRRLLSQAGIDLDAMTSWEQLGDELATIENRQYLVGVKKNGNFLNTTIEGSPEFIQPEIPADTRGLPQPSTAPVGTAGLFDDADVPF